jgi:hypothetical protein
MKSPRSFAIFSRVPVRIRRPCLLRRPTEK